MNFYYIIEIGNTDIVKCASIIGNGVYILLHILCE